MTDRSLDRKLDALLKRIEKLEADRSKDGPSTAKANGCESSSHQGLGNCNQPKVPVRELGSNVSMYRESIIRYIEKKWVNGTTLNYYFFENGPFKGESSNVDLVRRGFSAWEDLGIGITFNEVDDINSAQVRIGFLRGDGSWSYVGRDVIDIPGRLERTMNFGWDLTQDPRGGGLATPIHEIGHTLGFPHEHQNPFSGIVWDEEAVYREFGAPPNNWSRETTFHNILRKLSRQEVEGSSWDPTSIMHYGFGSGLIIEPAQYRNGISSPNGISDTDKSEVLKFYPPLDKRDYKKLVPFELQNITIGPGEQMNFVIEPERTDDYTIQTMGKTDTLLVLFEEVDGVQESIAGDDDSGTDLNAKIQVRLLKGRKYILRLRLYLKWDSGQAALLLT